MATASNQPTPSDRPVVAHRLLLRLLRSPVGGMFGGFCELRFLGRMSGRQISLPVQSARDDDRLVVYVGHAARKQWWRNFIDEHDVRVRRGGASRLGRGHIVGAEHPDRAAAERLYRRRYSRVDLKPADPLVVIELSTRADRSDVG